MCLSKRDDQTLATMGRIASYKPEVASNFALNADFDNQELRESVKSFWENKFKEEQLRNKKLFCIALSELEAQSEDPYNKLIIHWLEAFNEKCIAYSEES